MSERIRNSIAIQGINSAEPCHTVNDGTMTDIFNLRYKNRTYENMSEPQIIHPVSNFNGFIILHSMELLPVGRYIARLNSELHNVELVNSTVRSVQKIGDIGVEELTISHFGAILYAYYTVLGKSEEQCWIYKNETFTRFQLNELQPPEFEVTYERQRAKDSGQRPFLGLNLENLITGNLILKRHMQESKDIDYSLKDEYEYGIPISELHNAGYIVGDFVIMLAYRLFDGSVIKCSKPLFISSYKSDLGDEEDNPLKRVKYQEASNNTFEVYFYDIIRGIKPTIKLTFEFTPSDIVKNIVLLSTRDRISYDYENIYKKFGDGGTLFPESERAHRDTRSRILDKEYIFFEQPFYEVAEFDAGSKSITLNYDDHFKNIINQDLYKASYSLHDVLSKGKYEYNNRLHRFGISLKLFTGYNLTEDVPDSYFGSYVRTFNLDVNYDVQLLIDSEYHTIRKTSTAKVAFYDSIASESYRAAGIVVNNLVVYPDARAKSIILWFVYKGRKYQHNISLNSAAENNIAYFELPSSNQNFIDSFAKIELEGLDHNFISKADSGFIVQPNKLYVSAQNNPFMVMPSNIYSVGNSSCIIDSIDTAMEQITETKFGQFPLNAFTNKGIYAIETGSGEVLYQSVVGLSNDVKIPDTTTVGTSNLVFFISERGVMALQGRHIECISDQLDRYPSLSTGLDNFSNYKARAKLVYNPVEMELMVYNSRYNYAYIFSLNGKFWCRRSWSGKTISGANNQIVVTNGIASTWIEDKASPLRMCTLETRAIKLGSLEYKRIETLVARLSTGSSSYYEILLYGSNDLQKWTTIGKAEKTPMIRRTGASFKYFKLKIHCTVLDYFTITNFDTEFYPRFVHRLR